MSEKPYYERDSVCLWLGDCLSVLKSLPDDSVDLVFGSPPYEAARTYGIGFNLKGQAWVDWMVERWVEMQRVSRGMVAMVLAGQTRSYRWSATPMLLGADLHRAGLNLRDCCFFHRVGVPGSGGPDDFRHDVEFVIRTTKSGKLAWSDNTACGHPPKWAPGGEMSYRLANGAKVNQWGGGEKSRTRRPDGSMQRMGRPSHFVPAKTEPNGERREQTYHPPVKANPGTLITCTVGGGQMGDHRAHENEAAFPEPLAERFVLSFCPPGGTTLDPFSGSGTTGAVAVRHGRQYVGIDIRESQMELTKRRLSEVQLSFVEERPDVQTGLWE